MLTRVRGELKMRERVGEVRVDALLGHEHVRPKARHERRDDGVERAHVRRIVRIRGKRNVDAVAGSLAGAAFVGEPCAREKRAAGLVQRDGEHLVGLVERRLHTIPVMGVDVDVGDLHPAVGEEPTHDRRIVVDAEARRTATHRVMQPAGAVERNACATRDHLLHRHDRGAGREKRGIVHSPERGRVAPCGETPLGVIEVRLAGRPGDGVDVCGIVDTQDLGARRVARLKKTGAGPREGAEPLEGVVYAAQPPGLERMVFAVHVRRESRVPNESRGAAHVFRMRSSVRKLNG